MSTHTRVGYTCQAKAELYDALGPNNAPRLVEADLRELERLVNQFIRSDADS